MVALTVTLPKQAVTLSKTLPFSYPFLRYSFPLNFVSNPRHVCLSISSALSSPPLGEQSTKFVESARSGNLIPLHQCIFSDHLTPVLAYRCLVGENDHESPSFLLESVEPGLHTSNVGRYSILGANPAMEIMAKENSMVVIDHDEGWRMEEFVDDPLVVPQKITENWVPQCLDELPHVFCGGWFGFFSYDTLRYSAKRHTFSRPLSDDMNLPDVHLGLYDDVLVFDHVEKKIYVIHWVQLDQFPSTEAALYNGKLRLDSLLSRVYDIITPRILAGLIEPESKTLISKLEVTSTKREAYRKAVLKAKEDILVGDIRQVVLSQQFERRTSCDPFDVYRALSIVNPSPFMAYIQVRGCVVVASSSEILTCVDKKREITKRPFGGTVDRSRKTLGEDALSRKHVDGAMHYKEHIKLSEWANDYQKVASTCWDLLRATLPLGKLTEEPKVKALELIDELEGGIQGPYGGSFGCISFSGDLDLALSSRTIIFPNNKSNNMSNSWVAFLQGGASIKVDSDPRDVELVCEREAAVLARAIDLAESSFL